MIDYIDLSGSWELAMIEGRGADEVFSEGMPRMSDTIALPGTTSLARKGRPNNERAAGFLTDPYKFEGTAVSVGASPCPK